MVLGSRCRSDSAFMAFKELALRKNATVDSM